MSLSYFWANFVTSIKTGHPHLFYGEEESDFMAISVI